MNKPELNDRKCKDCNYKKESEFCLRCNKHTQTIISIYVSDTMTILDNVKGKAREKIGKAPHQEFLSGSFSSGDKKLTNGVDKYMRVNRKKDLYDQFIIIIYTYNII